MLFTRTLRICALLSLAAITATPAWCTLITTYTSYSQWLPNVDAGTLTDITFGQSVSGNLYMLPGATITLSGVAFDGVMYSGFSRLGIYANTYSSYYNFGSDGASPTGYLGTDVGGSFPSIDIYLPAGVLAFGTDLMTVSAGMNVSIAINGGAPYTGPLTQPAPTRVFFGVTSDTPITHISFTTTGVTELIDHFRFGTTQQQQAPPPDAPEAATMVLIGTGLLGLRIMKRRMM